VAHLRLPTFLLLVLAAGPIAAMANPARDAILAGLAAEARQAGPAFAGFSASRGAAFWQADHAGGKPETPSCTTCHTKDPTAEGRTRAGKTIAPMAISRTPGRFTDAAKVDKWFTRNCASVLGRACSPAEKGDIISYLSGK
jgi:Domain of unknown function (DUF1924)